jgi:drug/metabolite transporter (DMT)-like permease
VGDDVPRIREEREPRWQPAAIAILAGIGLSSLAIARINGIEDNCAERGAIQLAVLLGLVSTVALIGGAIQLDRSTRRARRLVRATAATLVFVLLVGAALVGLFSLLSAFHLNDCGSD